MPNVEVLHLNCGTMHPFGLPAADDTGGPFKRGDGVIHCLLINTGDGLALVDTGWGVSDCAVPSSRVQQFADMVGSSRDLKETATRQIEALGYKPTDIKHIFLTHMHLDHAGGLPDFPAATVHIYIDELDACLHPRSPMERWAYQPEHRAHNPKWKVHRLEGAQWFGLDCTPSIRIGQVEFVMIPLPGHTRGHCGIAVSIDNQWLLHSGDVYGYYRQIDLVQPYKHPCGQVMERLVTTGFNMPRHHWKRIRELLQAHGEQIQVFCSHDAHEFELCSHRTKTR